MKELKISELNKMYTEAEDSDREVYSEQRSNILLIAGDHYNQRSGKYSFNSRARDSKNSLETQRLRLTKNHLHRVYRNYVGNILSYSPGVTILPQNELEIQDQKTAEMHAALWTDAKSRYRMQEKVRSFCQDFVGVGEVAVKVFFDPNRGELQGYEQLVDSEGMPVLDEMGQPQSDDEKPVFSGEFVFERVFGFNLMRAPGAKSMDESPYFIIRKMVDLEHLKSLYKGDEEKLKKISKSKEDTFVVFDSNKAEYNKAKDQSMVREYYWKPCYDYPTGYFAITTEDVILSEGELPYGLFPIVWAGFDEYPTTPRGRSIIKQLRPFQAELNRAASAMATHQVTLGDDKVVYQSGTKLSPGSLLPGVRGITFNGITPPTVLPGRDGGQFLPYIESQTAELYTVAEMAEENAGKPTQADPYALLFASMKQRRKYALYSEKFEQFLIDLCELYLNLAKKYLPDDMLIAAIGRKEQVNIPEFRNTTKLCYQIKVEPRDETVETQLGKQLTMNHILQYVGPQLGKDDVGKIIRNMPFANNEESFRDMTLPYDTAKNDFLSIERGEMPLIVDVSDHEYLVKKVASRMGEPDFRFLPPQVQQLYTQYKKAHEQVLEKQAQALIDAKNEFIPVGGALIAADLYIPNQDPSKAAKRVRVPYQALDWLVNKLEAQGAPLDKLEKMNQGVVTDMASDMNNQKQNPSMPRQMPPNQAAGMEGQASPLGVS